MSRVAGFYDRYHRQNHGTAKVIGDSNFTYFYILDFLHRADILPLAPSRTRPLKVLDIGCGVGTLALYLATKGAEVTGWDVSPRAIRFAQATAKQLGVTTATFQVAELSRGQADYDVVICTEVIEHIPDDQLFAQLLASHLKPGGKLVLTTPSSDNWLFRHGYYQEFDQRVGHVRRYTPASITRTLKQADLKVKNLRTVEGPLRNLLFTTKLGFLIKGIRGPLVPLFHVFDSWSAQLAGAADIQVIATKPRYLA